MKAIHLTLIVITQIHCEWVEISQHYNYKKPVRPTHNHPILAATTTRKVDVERTTNRNRIYVNHSVPDVNINSGINKWNKDDVKSAAVKFKDRDGFNNKKPDSNKNIVIIRRRKPENEVKIEDHNDQGNSGSSKGMTKKPLEDRKDNNKPLEVNKEPIEVIDLSELEYTTAYDIANNKFRRKEDFVEITSPQNGNRRLDSETKEPVEASGPGPDNERNTKPPLLKTNNMRRVNIIRSTSTYRTPTKHFQEENYQTSTPEFPTKSNNGVRIKEKPLTTPHRFPHIGYVKRVNITNTSRTTTQSTFMNRSTANSNRNKVNADKNINADDNTNRRLNISSGSTKIKAHNTKHEEEDDQKDLSPENIMVTQDNGKTDFRVQKVTSVGNVHRVKNPLDSEKERRKDRVKNKVTTTNSPEQEADTDGTTEIEDSDDRYNRISTEQIPTMSFVKFKSKDTATERPDEVSQIERYQPNPYKPIRPSSKSGPEFVTKDENFVNKESRYVYETTSDTSSKLKPTEANYKENEKSSRNDSKSNNNRQGQENENKEEKKEDPISDKTKPSAIENLIKFLKTVTQIISRNSRRGVLGKVRYLEDLRDTILANIEERLEEAFPDEARRTMRSAEPRGHVEFPSSESALMTISFLTFAVFLIKLILQVIHAYKNKTMMVMPTVISAAAVGRGFTQPRTDN